VRLTRRTPTDGLGGWATIRSQQGAWSVRASPELETHMMALAILATITVEGSMRDGKGTGKAAPATFPVCPSKKMVNRG
jgi:hypothetical protein